MKKHVTLVNFFLSLLVSNVFMVLIWRDFDARVMVLFVFFLAVAETFVQVRWRLSVCCPHCSFDPVLYVKNPEAVSARVKKRLDEVKLSPKYLLAKTNPLLQLPKVKRTSPITVRDLSEISIELPGTDVSVNDAPDQMT